MPRASTRKNINNFVGGLNTEASPLSFPETTAKEIDNVDLGKDGSLKRRRGLEYELGYSFMEEEFTEEFLSTAAVTAFEWESVDGDDSLNFLVVQVGCTLYFHNLGGDSVSSSYLGKLCLEPVKIDETSYITEPMSMVSGKGKLFVVSKGISPVYIQYDPDEEIFEGVKLTLKVRDIDGIQEEDTSPPVFGDSVTPPPALDPDDNFYDIPDVFTPPVIVFERPTIYI
jgi:hypothetical protein